MFEERKNLNLCIECRFIFEGKQKLPNGRLIQEQIFSTDVGYEYHRTRECIKASAKDKNCAFCLNIDTQIFARQGASDADITSHKVPTLWCSSNAKVCLRLKYQRDVGCLRMYHATNNHWKHPSWRDENESCIISWDVRVEDSQCLRF
jgi:hypothetical protein